MRFRRYGGTRGSTPPRGRTGLYWFLIPACAGLGGPVAGGHCGAARCQLHHCSVSRLKRSGRSSIAPRQARTRRWAASTTPTWRGCTATASPRVGDETEAEDLTEEIFLKVLGAIDRFEWRPGAEGQRIPFGAWIFRIARNEVASFQRRAAARPRRAEFSDLVAERLRDEGRGPQELAETKLTIEEVFRAVRQLPEAQRDVILLRFASGLSVKETAESLGKNVPNVKVLQHKGVQRLREVLTASPETREARRP